jgi:hypothetical protein
MVFPEPQPVFGHRHGLTMGDPGNLAFHPVSFSAAAEFERRLPIQLATVGP